MFTTHAHNSSTMRERKRALVKTNVSEFEREIKDERKRSSTSAFTDVDLKNPLILFLWSFLFVLSFPFVLSFCGGHNKLSKSRREVVNYARF